MTHINSVSGPISPDDLGFTLMHEHVMVSASGLYDSYPDLLGADREAKAIACLAAAKAAGVDTMRNPDKYLYMHKHVIPELQQMGVSEATIELLFVTNPRRFLGGN